MKRENVVAAGCLVVIFGAFATGVAGCGADEATPEPGTTLTKTYAPGGSNKNPLTMTYLGDVNGYGLYSFCDRGARLYFHDTSYGGKITAVLDHDCIGK